MQGKQLTGSLTHWFEGQQDQLKQGDQAYYRLRNKILSLQLEPGAHVDELGLSKLLGLGRTPIREALQRLAHDSLVTIIPRKGTIISPINTVQLKEAQELRWELDCLAARWAAERATEEQLGLLETFIEEISRTDLTDRYHHVEADRHFHLQLARAAQNRYLAGTLDQLFNHSVRLVNAAGAPMATTSEEVHDYRQIAAALRARDPDAAEQAMQVHLRESGTRVAAAYGAVLNPEH